MYVIYIYICFDCAKTRKGANFVYLFRERNINKF